LNIKDLTKCLDAVLRTYKAKFELTFGADLQSFSLMVMEKSDKDKDGYVTFNELKENIIDQPLLAGFGNIIAPVPSMIMNDFDINLFVHNNLATSSSSENTVNLSASAEHVVVTEKNNKEVIVKEEKEKISEDEKEKNTDLINNKDTN